MGRTTIVSNRLPVALERDASRRWTAAQSSGGLVQALHPVLRRHGGRWIGWAGIASEECSPDDVEAVLAGIPTDGDDRPVRLVPVDLGSEDVGLFYEGFSNAVLWPLFHGFVDRCQPEPRSWEAYRRVNARFARRILDDLGSGDTIWIHDFHLLLVGRQVRRARPDATLGFFLHIPFPTADQLAALPWRRELLEAMLAHDLVGLQSTRDLHNFAACLERHLDLSPRMSHGALRIPADGRTVVVRPFAIGMDAVAWRELAASREVARRMSELRGQLGSPALLIGVDRLDYTKGIVERLAAYERLLERRPDLRERVVLYQLVVPSRENVGDYAALKDQLDREVGRLCGRFATPGWVPVRYQYSTVSRQDLAALYRMADVALVTPICDGMNLVAKEYCAAQVDGLGVLVLGQGAGAAEELGPAGAILVDPRDIEGLASAIEGALIMGVSERRARMDRMRRVVTEADVYHWADRYLAELERARPVRRPSVRVAHPTASVLETRAHATSASVAASVAMAPENRN